MNIEDLKEGDKIYVIDRMQINWYTYLCVAPKSKKFEPLRRYYIFIDSLENPIRIYGERLQQILYKHFKTYREAELGLADKLEEMAKDIRKQN